MRVDVIEGGNFSHDVAVVVPFSEKRSLFFERYCLPSIRENRPSRIIIVSGEESASKKRNLGFTYVLPSIQNVFFCDDDVILACGLFVELIRLLQVTSQSDPSIGYSYCDYLGVVMPGVDHPMGSPTVWKHRAGDFSENRLRQGNYISTMSLVRTDLLRGSPFDENLSRLQDWDLWLSLAARGVNGVWLPKTGFHAYYLDSGITSGDGISYADAEAEIRKKHGI